MLLPRAPRSVPFLAAAALALCCAPEEPGVPRSVILVTIDTYRGDHFLETRAGRPLTPELERLARRSIWFAEATSASNATSPGTAAILTGLLPHRSGVIRNRDELALDLPTLATLLGREGFRTAAFMSNPVLSPGTGFENGFEVYERLRPAVGEDGVDRAKPRAEAVSEAALAWLSGLERGERFLLWVHYMEPHGPYRPPADARELFPKESFDAPREIPLLKGDSGRGGIPLYQQAAAAPEDVQDGRDYLARYAAEVWSLDRALGDLLAALRADGFLRRSILVLTADHGEALVDDHGRYFSHANGLTRDQVHVPLLLRFPGCPEGVRIERPVSTLDVVPTVLGLLGIETPAELDGTDLLSGGPHTVVSQCADEIALRDGRWKLTRKRNRRTFLFDVASDPGEEADLAGEHPEVLDRMKRRLQELEGLRPLAEPVERR